MFFFLFLFLFDKVSLSLDIVRGVRKQNSILSSLTDGLCRAWGAVLVSLENVRRLAVDLAVHELFEATHCNPGVLCTLIAKHGLVRIVERLSYLPDIH